jgi:hypothetical protein
MLRIRTAAVLFILLLPVATAGAATGQEPRQQPALQDGPSLAAPLGPGTGHSRGTTVDVQPRFPLRAAFYRPWMPAQRTPAGLQPYAPYHPTWGSTWDYYQSGDPAILREQVGAMQYGRIQVGLAEWWGPGTHTDGRVAALLRAARGTTFRWALWYQSESVGDLPVRTLGSDLAYLRSHYGSDPNYLRIRGRVVVFVQAAAQDGCAMAARLRQANAAVHAYVVLTVFPGYRGCASQPDDWYEYAPARADDQEGSSFSISPGCSSRKCGLHLNRDLGRWSQNIRNMIASHQRWQLVTTFNYWGNGSAVESATEWASTSGYGLYLDALHNNGTTRAPADPVIMAAGDISCDPSERDGTVEDSADGVERTIAASCRMQATSDLAILGHPAAVLTLGDEQYEHGSLAAFRTAYDRTWGRVKAITHPVPGNHEYYFPKATGYYQYFGPLAPDKGYYSFDLGAWHIIALNAQCAYVGGCDAGSPEEQWLQADLAAHPGVCTLAYWHQPRFSSGLHNDSSQYTAFWEDLYAAGADVVLNGHDHDYERFGPQSPRGEADPRRGIREFVVGTGGASHYPWGSIQPNSQVRNDLTFGVLALTLHQASYDWRFIPEPGQSFADAGHASCHSAPPAGTIVFGLSNPTSPTALALAGAAVLLCALCLGGLSLAVRFGWLRGATR